MISLFEKNLKRAKQELTDLKTAHNRGLGATEFYRNSISFTIPSAGNYIVSADIAVGEPERPLVTPLLRWSGSRWAAITTARSEATQVHAYIYASGGSSVVVDFISSSILKNLSWRSA